MSTFSHLEFNDHEQVVFCQDRKSGLKAIIGIHNTNLGPALGGCRMFPYASDDDALTDVLRLSEGMSYKSAMANLPFGGGKCVVIADPHRTDKTELLKALSGFVNRLNGLYVTTQDSGITVDDLKCMSQFSKHVVYAGKDGGGSPSPYTAYGVFLGIKSAARHRLQSDDLKGVRVIIEGIGSVGYGLAKHLHQEGAELLVKDVSESALKRVQEDFDARVIEDVHVEADVYAPCAFGGTLNLQSVEQLQVSIVAGAANNQLQSPDIAQLLAQRSILYAPDYVINAGGVISISSHISGEGEAVCKERIEQIGSQLDTIFQQAGQQQSTHDVANQLAKQRLNDVKRD